MVKYTRALTKYTRDLCRNGFRKLFYIKWSKPRVHSPILKDFMAILKVCFMDEMEYAVVREIHTRAYHISINGL